MPVEFVSKKNSRRLRFTRNTAYNGTNYGPDYPENECDVETRFAYQFIGQGRAVEVQTAAPAAASEPRTIETRDPRPTHRDPQLEQASRGDLGKLTKAELVALAEKHDVDLGDAKTKAQIVEVLEAARPK